MLRPSFNQLDDLMVLLGSYDVMYGLLDLNVISIVISIIYSGITGMGECGCKYNRNVPLLEH